jgi:hypothetical protein
VITPTHITLTVDGVKQREFGYQELFLSYQGRRVGFKAIVKNDIFVTIVSTKYTLITHEEIDKKVREFAGQKGLRVEQKEDGWRKYWLIQQNDAGILVVNSVDGSLSLKVFCTLKVGNVNAILTKVKILSKKHYESAKEHVENLEEEMQVILQAAEENLPYLTKMDRELTKEEKEFIQKIDLPEYVTRAMASTMAYTTNLKQIYQAAATAIWRGPAHRKTGIKTIIEHFKKLNDVIFGLTWV